MAAFLDYTGLVTLVKAIEQNYLGIDDKAVSASKLDTGALVDGVLFDGSAAISHFGVSSTAATVAAKTVSVDNFELVSGAYVFVKFSKGNSASSPTLNVNSTGDILIARNGVEVSAGSLLGSDKIYAFVYDGVNYEVVASDIADDAESAYTTYSSSKIASEITNATAALKEEILGGAAETYDTLKELYDLLNAGDTTIQELVDGLKNVRYDEAQDLSDDQKAQARSNIDAVSSAELEAVQSELTAHEEEYAVHASLKATADTLGHVTLADEASASTAADGVALAPVALQTAVSTLTESIDSVASDVSTLNSAVASALGGNSAITEDGSLTVGITVNGEDYTSVTDAVNAVQGYVSDIENLSEEEILAAFEAGVVAANE